VKRSKLFRYSLIWVALILPLTLSSSVAAQTETVLYNFTGGSDGLQPQGLTRDSAGNLYGATRSTIFELSPGAGGSWNFNTLYTFSDPAYGSSPSAGFVFDSKGNMYGTTYAGGSSAKCSVAGGCGVVFELSPSADGWVESVLYSFNGQKDGFGPEGYLVFDRAGNLYGVTREGGNLSCSIQGAAVGCGTVFELLKTSGGWRLSVLHTFTGGADGAVAAGGLVMDSSGNLFDTTIFGGSRSGICALYGCGVAFRLSRNPAGKWLQDTIHTFTGDDDGEAPEAGLTRDAAGNLFGTTYEGGAHYCGTAFELSPSSSGVWPWKALFAFDCVDGTPSGPLTFDAKGNLYSASFTGGPYGGGVCAPVGCGVAFKLWPPSQGLAAWTETVLYDFTPASDGWQPTGGVVTDAAGHLYGTALASTAGSGNIYEITQ
jgi:uncharacterized repeat protein (TIGR03803 family)